MIWQTLDMRMRPSVNSFVAHLVSLLHLPIIVGQGRRSGNVAPTRVVLLFLLFLYLESKSNPAAVSKEGNGFDKLIGAKYEGGALPSVMPTKILVNVTCVQQGTRGGSDTE